jgi:hypothetical protein
VLSPVEFLLINTKLDKMQRFFESFVVFSKKIRIFALRSRKSSLKEEMAGFPSVR